MFGKKTLLAAAALAALSAAGAGSASAAPYDHRDHRGYDRHPGATMHRHYVDRVRIERALRVNHYRMFGDPFFARGHYVVRTHDRFGHVVLVRVDPYSGAFLGEFRM
jgi:hypothetical protein